MRFLSIALVSAMALSGCYKASIHLKSPQASMVSPLVDENMHVSVVGLWEFSKPIDLDAACLSETVSIKEEVSVLGGIVNIVLGSVLPIRVMNPSVMCSAGAASLEVTSETE